MEYNIYDYLRDLGEMVRTGLLSERQARHFRAQAIREWKKGK